MQASEFIAAGNIEAGLQKLKESIRNAPADPALRSFLFQVYSITGNWEGAATQLNVLSDLGADHEMFVQVYRRVLQCEVARRAVHAGNIKPVVFGEPSEWVSFMVQALQLLAKGEGAAAAELYARALDQATPSAGTLDGNRFEWIADGDSTLGPLLEVYVDGNYWWVPFERIQSIQSEGPKFVLDSIWMPVQFTWTNGGIAAGFIPVRYAGSDCSADSAIGSPKPSEKAS